MPISNQSELHNYHIHLSTWERKHFFSWILPILINLYRVAFFFFSLYLHLTTLLHGPLRWFTRNFSLSSLNANLNFKESIAWFIDCAYATDYVLYSSGIHPTWSVAKEMNCCYIDALRTCLLLAFPFWAFVNTRPITFIVCCFLQMPPLLSPSSSGRCISLLSHS